MFKGVLIALISLLAILFNKAIAEDSKIDAGLNSFDYILFNKAIAEDSKIIKIDKYIGALLCIDYAKEVNAEYNKTIKKEWKILDDKEDIINNAYSVIGENKISTSFSILLNGGVYEAYCYVGKYYIIGEGVSVFYTANSNYSDDKKIFKQLENADLRQKLIDESLKLKDLDNTK
jgi:hypothetical protein